MIKNIIPICLFALGLTACGGGGSSDTSNTGANVINASAMNGIYVGEGSESGFGTFELIAFIQGGQIRAVADTGVGYSGALTAKEDGTYQSSLTLYDFDAAAFDTAGVQGNFESASFFDGSYERSSGPSGSFSATYSAAAYEQPASLDMIDGTWAVTNATVSNSITINTNGDFFGTDADGCVYSGEISVPNPNRNLYQADLLIESCGSVNGSYTGLIGAGINSSGDTLLMLVSNSSFGFAFDLSKL